MLNDYGVCYDVLGDSSEAINLYAKSIQAKENPLAYLNRGRLYKKNNQFKLAIEDMQNVLQLDQTSAQAYLIIGNSYAQLGDKEKAIKAYKQGLALNPKPNIKDF